MMIMIASKKAENINRSAAVGAEREKKIGCEFRASSSYRALKDHYASSHSRNDYKLLLFSGLLHSDLSIPSLCSSSECNGSNKLFIRFVNAVGMCWSVLLSVGLQLISQIPEMLFLLYRNVVPS